MAKNDTTGVVGAKLYVIGGTDGGLSTLEGGGTKTVVAAEKSQARCGS